MGIPLSSILSTKSVNNTYQEAKEIKELIKKNNLPIKKEIILVTSAFHMKRAKKIFEREGFKVQPFPVDFKRNSRLSYQSIINPYFWFPNADALASSSKVLREIMVEYFTEFRKL